MKRIKMMSLSRERPYYMLTDVECLIHMHCAELSHWGKLEGSEACRKEYLYSGHSVQLLEILHLMTCMNIQQLFLDGAETKQKEKIKEEKQTRECIGECNASIKAAYASIKRRAFTDKHY